MKTLALVVVALLAGCATSNRSETTARILSFQDQSEEISKREQQCIKAAVSRSNEQAAWVARPDALAGQVARQADTDEDHEIAQCKDAARSDQDELAARLRSEYQDEAQQQRDRASLIMILTTSRPQ